MNGIILLVLVVIRWAKQMNSVKHKPIGTEHARAAIRWLSTDELIDLWELSIEDQVSLLGKISEVQLAKWTNEAKLGRPIYLNDEITERLSILLSIYKQLKIIAPSGKMKEGIRCFCKPNSNKVFSGLSPKEFIINNGNLESFRIVLEYLNQT